LSQEKSTRRKTGWIFFVHENGMRRRSLEIDKDHKLKMIAGIALRDK